MIRPSTPLVFAGPATQSARLTGFEFVPSTDLPQVVRLRLKGREQPLMVFVVLQWLSVSLCLEPLIFETPDDLEIEGEGVGRPYWNDEPMPWTHGFDPASEWQRINQIRRAADQLRARGGSLLAMS